MPEQFQQVGKCLLLLLDAANQVAAIAEVWPQNGYIRIAGQARPGYRLKLVVSRDVVNLFGA
jgi:hypothetical protein